MTIKQVIIALLTILFLTSCRQGYKVEDEKVYYESWNEGSGQGKRLIGQADPKTFQELSINCDCSFEFGKDKSHLFIDGELMENIDPNTFSYVGNYIFRDKDSAYFFGFYDQLNNCVIQGIDPDKIELIKYPWAKAGNVLIHGKDTVTLDDVNEFVPMDEDWGKTGKYIINTDKIVYGADVETFTITSSFQGKDKNYHYEFGIISEDDFKNVSYQTFDFDQKAFCQSEPIVFTDLYDSLVSYDAGKEKIEVVEKLKSNGFTVDHIQFLNLGESKVIRVTLANDQCGCTVEKLYRYDYSKPSGTKRIFKATERMRCEPKGK